MLSAPAASLSCKPSPNYYGFLNCRLYDVACGCRLEGSAAEVGAWLRGADLERAVSPYCKADLLRGLNREVLLKEDASVEGRCSEAFAAVRRFEESHKVAAKVISFLITMRASQAQKAQLAA